MSSATKSKSKDRSSSKAAKEQQKSPSKLLKETAPVNGGNNAYNPISGTFHSLETVPFAPSPTPQSNGRFRTIDEQSGSSNGTSEYDSMSNNDSCSGESEDQKEKAVATTTSRLEAIPGSDTDKQEKIRQKNERKHQRQKERRAQELHERCCRCLMSRKLESLSQQLVAMGFPSERATMALILNGGRVEESVAWLFEGGEEGEQPTNPDVGNNLKIDISSEMAKMAEMEIKFKCSKQEVERAIVACEGDVEKTEETLKAQKQEPPTARSKSEMGGEPSVTKALNKIIMSTQNMVTRTQVKAVNSATSLQLTRDERDFNYTKASVLTGDVPSDSSGSRNLQHLRHPQPKAEWTRLQEAAVTDKRWSNASSSLSVSYSLTSPLQVAVPPGKAEARYTVVGSEAKTNSQTGLREPVIVMQRPQSHARQNPSSAYVGLNAPPAVTSGWHINGVSNIEMMKATSGGLGPNLQPSMSLSTSSPGPTLPYRQNLCQPFLGSSTDTAIVGLGGRWNAGTSLGMTSSASSLAVPSSLGLFTGSGSSGSSGSSSPVDWSSTGSLMMQCDYASIDWSLDSTPLRQKHGPSMVNGQLYDAWATTHVGSKLGRPGINGGVCIAGLQDGGIAIDPCLPAGSREWTSPFAGKDIFSLPRQFVTSPPK